MRRIANSSLSFSQNHAADTWRRQDPRHWDCCLTRGQWPSVRLRGCSRRGHGRVGARTERRWNTGAMTPLALAKRAGQPRFRLGLGLCCPYRLGGYLLLPLLLRIHNCGCRRILSWERPAVALELLLLRRGPGSWDHQSTQEAGGLRLLFERHGPCLTQRSSGRGAWAEGTRDASREAGRAEEREAQEELVGADHRASRSL